jgi:RNA polymerase sigma-70 factor, ECF subfamily
MPDHPQSTITAAMQRVHAGDTAALHQLVAEHLPWIEAHVRRRLTPLLRRDGDTHDHVQAAMVDVLSHGPHFASDQAELFRALLARIVENNLVDRVRYLQRGRRDVRRELPLPTDSLLLLDAAARSVSQPPANAVANEQQAWLALAVELLAPDDREAIRLRDWQGLSFVELGAQLGISEEAARKRYVRALPKLAQKLERLRGSDAAAMVEAIDNA